MAKGNRHEHVFRKPDRKEKSCPDSIIPISLFLQYWYWLYIKYKNGYTFLQNIQVCCYFDSHTCFVNACPP